jgi:ribonuclease-3
MGDPLESNERLEFLGDAVLSLFVSELLMELHPGVDEGALSLARASAVNTRALAERARALGLDAYVKLGRGEQRSGGSAKDSILENTFEAVLGAVYLDGGAAAARELIEREVGPTLANVQLGTRDPKTELQQQLHRVGRGVPEYETLATHGPPHAPEFEVEVRSDGWVLGLGRGRSKRAAQQAAAQVALDALALLGRAEGGS